MDHSAFIDGPRKYGHQQNLRHKYDGQGVFERLLSPSNLSVIFLPDIKTNLLEINSICRFGCSFDQTIMRYIPCLSWLVLGFSAVGLAVPVPGKSNELKYAVRLLISR